MAKKKQTIEERKEWFRNHAEYMRSKYPKGEQVADNQGLHYTIHIQKTPEGAYYTPIDSQPKKIPYRSEYLPSGRSLQFPQKWGRKKAAELLVRKRMEDLEIIIERTQRELTDLKRLYDEIPNWSDDVDWVRGGK